MAATTDRTMFVRSVSGSITRISGSVASPATRNARK